MKKSEKMETDAGIRLTIKGGICFMKQRGGRKIST